MRIDRSIQPCPACHHADDVTHPTLSADGDLEFVCSHTHGGTGPLIFRRPAVPLPMPRDQREPRVPKAEERLTDDLLDPLRECIAPQDGWVEYGVLEHRLRVMAPAVFARHVTEADHIMFGPRVNTASKDRINRALRRLRDRGQLEHRMDRSTGAAWRHDRTISFWRAVPVGPKSSEEASSQILTWVDYCADLGRSDDWTDLDRVGLTPPAVDPA